MLPDGYLEGLGSWSLIEVVWRDAYDAPNGWTDMDTYKPEDQIARTVGYFWKGCQEHYVTLCGTIFEYELPRMHTVGNVTHVPTEMILAVNLITKKTRRTKNERTKIHSPETRTRQPGVADSKVEG